ncbi:methyl-accepting chemotaxis protein [Pantoea sp. B65]|uniref:methyl-accepting chemotaxis protein n=1 Tax=Pantoea sp. B65 TaxID=2813359 RepID=UPI0039B4C144
MPGGVKTRTFSILTGCIAIILLFSSLQLFSTFVLSKILHVADSNTAAAAELRQQQQTLDRARMALVIASDKLNRAGVYFMEDKETGSVGSWNSLVDEAQTALKESQQSYQHFTLLSQQTAPEQKEALAALKASYEMFFSGIVEEADGLSKKGNIDAFFNVPIQAFQSDFNDKYFQFQSVSAQQSDRLSDSLLHALMQAKWLSVATLLLLLLIAIAVWQGVNRWVIRPLKQVNAQLHIMADGDLAASVLPADKGSREVRQLAQNMRIMQQGLVKLVADVQQASGYISINIDQIVKGNQELSLQSSTQHQALTQASDHLAALNQQVKNNVLHAQAANCQSEQARVMAAGGNLVMQKVDQSMKGIVSHSTEMSSIVEIIESVAFQTNLLALNAAIEAAHAGAQGRGFAVVAREVGALASKSSQSSRDIQQLIRSSVEQIGKGADSVGQLGIRLQEVIGVIAGLNALVQEITAESVHQSQSIDDVAERIATLDKVTQRNHTLVSNTASSSTKLSGQCQQLAQAIARFRLPA